MARLTRIDRESLPRDQQRFYDAVLAIRRRPISGPFIVLTNASPDLAARYAQLGHYFHARGQADESILPIRVRSFISLIGSRVLEAPYEWAAWMNWALDAGVPQRTVDAIREGEAPELDSTEKLVSEFCSGLVSGNHRVSDALFSAARQAFGDQGLVELVVTLGYFAMIAFPLNAFEMEMTPVQLAQRKPFAPLRVRGTPWREGAGVRETLPSLVEPRVDLRLRAITDHDHLAPSNQHFLDRVIRSRGWVSPLFALLLLSPDVAERIAHIGAYILYESPLTPDTKALVSLVTARELDAPYTWAAAMGMARESGLDASLASAIEHGELRHASGAQRALATFCLQLLRPNHHVSDEVYGRMLEHYGLSQAVQVSALAGYVAMTSIVATAFELDAGAASDRPLL